MKGLIREFFWNVFTLAGIHHVFRYYNRKKVLILMYHGTVEQVPRFSCWTQLPVDKFKCQVRYLNKYYRVMHLGEILRRLRQKEALPHYVAAITFDDGFQNNYSVAYPFLKAERIPATIFLVTHNTGTSALIWTDRLLVAFRDTDREELDLKEFGGGKLRIKTRREREHGYRTVLAGMKKLSVGDKNRLLKVITDLLGKPRAVCDVKDFLPLSWQEVREMHESGLVKFGAHTEHHEILSRLDCDAMRAEIENSCAAIRDRLKQEPVLFAYPNGSQDDFDETAKEILREQRVLGALSTIEGLNEPDEDLYELKRIGVSSDMTRSRFVLLCSGFTPWLKSLIRR